jgi:hypothetical protein
VEILKWGDIQSNVKSIAAIVVLFAGIGIIAGSRRTRIGDSMSTAAVVLIGAAVAGAGVGLLAFGGALFNGLKGV